MKKIYQLALPALLLCLASLDAWSAHSWQLNAEASKIAYGSIKQEKIGEVNHFKSIDGQISSSGDVRININLASVETNIGIRNERLLKHVFKDQLTATLTATINMRAVEALPVGGSTTLAVSGVLTFSEKQVPITTDFFIARLGKEKLLATTNSMIMLSTEALGVNKGIDTLMGLAKLQSITRVVPVSVRLVFGSDTTKPHE